MNNLDRSEKKDHFFKNEIKNNLKIVRTILKTIVVNERFLVLADPQCTLVDPNGIVCVISSDPSCKNDYARFTMVPLKPLSDLGFSMCKTT